MRYDEQYKDKQTTSGAGRYDAFKFREEIEKRSSMSSGASGSTGTQGSTSKDGSSTATTNTNFNSRKHNPAEGAPPSGLDSLSITDIKVKLVALGVDTEGCLEKAELINLLQRALATDTQSKDSKTYVRLERVGERMSSSGAIPAEDLFSEFLSDCKSSH